MDDFPVVKDPLSRYKPGLALSCRGNFEFPAADARKENRYQFIWFTQHLEKANGYAGKHVAVVDDRVG